MAERGVSILPLYHFIELLRQNEFPLGTGEYERFLKALNLYAGIDIDDYEVIINELAANDALTGTNNAYPRNFLLRLCKLMWLKPGQNARLFEDLFEEAFVLDFTKVKRNPENVVVENENQDNKIADKPTMDKKNAPTIPDIPQANQNDNAKIDREIAENKTIAQTEEEETVDNSVLVRIETGEDDSNKKIDLDPDEMELEKSNFLITHNYVKLNNRQIQQELRKFSSFRITEPTSEIDIDATINKATKKGFFNEVAYKLNKKSNAVILMLIDHEGSMVAFDNLSDNIASQLNIFLQRDKKKKDSSLKVHYFNNVWGDFLFLNRQHTLYSNKAKVVNSLKNKHSMVIIISDGGAARGTLNQNRVKATIEVLDELKKHTHKIAWLNPMPAKRWKKTSAAKIAEQVSMFEADESGVRNMVQLFKGTHNKTLMK